MKILIVEDDHGYRKLLKVYLSSFGTCDAVSNGYEAIEFFKRSIRDQDRYDLICLDNEMPGIDGVGTLKAIRQIEKQYEINWKKRSRIIMETVAVHPGDVMKALHLGCDSYLDKDGKKETLINEMQILGLLSPVSAIA